MRQQFWILVIESKSAQFDVMSALPQALAYLLAKPHSQQESLGLLVNGREFVFLKLLQQAQYLYSRAFSIEQSEDFCWVLSILKFLSQQTLKADS
ncbi:MAG: hypothetical protein BRC40_10620 [Cyanobacteria bacterium QH_8_48_120]|nr:MAG: hypothetical protein BRC34_10380 [Cyanobacteria bacterium QH_1_48_107]PSO55397.1 MAG: hypothetical protein BRC35_12120 [Cyanobacteria bacterium QH_10_48_56]PSO58889.1 MAG: hypothetical protein BRC39_12295 [Cyanobacteria bacterium QH_7_48_89]PSO65121.1 MAG: hypothetical protein BRC38_10020 [Cyanobacteria bacterium QH_6_48_35]PSO68583.1 MAG: hypothetical protein BRC42_13310 [Cyanobacteria bacterium QS_1_48_34]PSO72069.1 MAG: hypothetical protein BRC40_10620 [Cyanobacteria bacterium QH_8_